MSEDMPESTSLCDRRDAVLAGIAPGYEPARFIIEAIYDCGIAILRHLEARR
jgi:hypothetical protein